MKKILIITILIIVQNVFADSNCEKTGFTLWGQEVYETPDGIFYDWGLMQDTWSTALPRQGEIGIISNKEIPKNLELELEFVSKKKVLLKDNMKLLQDNIKHEQMYGNFAHTSKKQGDFLDKALKISDKGELIIKLKIKDKIICTFHQRVFIAWENLGPEDPREMD